MTVMTLPGWLGPGLLAGLAAGLAASLAAAVLAARTATLRAARQRRESERQQALHLSSLDALTGAIDGRDPFRRHHTRRVRAYAGTLAHCLDLPADERRTLRVAAMLHDVGKLVVPDHLLNKPGRLSESEFEKVRTHPAAGAALLAPAGLPEPVLRVIRHHHERWDGSGYPDRLRGETIPRAARVLAVADAFEALTSDRSYRGRMDPQGAAALLSAWSGVHFDPDVVQALVTHLDAVVAAPEETDPGSRLEDEDDAAADRALIDAGGFGDALHRGIVVEEGRAGAGTGGAMPRDEVPRPLHGGPRGAGVQDQHAAQREVYALYEIAQTLGSSVQLTEVLDLVVSKIAQMVPYRTCIVWLAHSAGEELTARFVAGANAAALRGRRMRTGAGITGWAAEHRSTRFAANSELDLAGSSVDPSGYATVAAFPLCQGDDLLGVITLYFPVAVPCHDDHIRMMEIIARLVAGAVRNGRMTAADVSGLTDATTHLPSGRYLKQLFEQETIRSQQSGHPLAILEMDLDEFKALNDRFGQPAGDRYLMEVGRVLRSHLRERDVLVRLQEDEFAALLPGSGFAAAALLAERLQQAVDSFGLRLEETGQMARAGVSIGIAVYPLDGETLDDLLARAMLNRARNKHARRSSRAATPNVIRFPQLP
jgi:diguanylate cyclase (GGDEF)-like protein/putative nucleotidyltransferase with HDIG domain